MEKSVYLCEFCEADHNEAQWREFQRNASWFPTAGLSEVQERDIVQHFREAKSADPAVRSYWRNGFNSLLPTAKGYASKLHQFVAEGEAAKTSRERLMVWTQEIKCDLWDPEGDSEPPPDWRKVYERREKY